MRRLISVQFAVFFVYEKRRFDDFVEFVDVHDSIFVNREVGQEPKGTGKLLGQLVLNV
jgi:hypothetical protein